MEECNFCKESKFEVGQKTDYGSVIVQKIGNAKENSWFATLSPKTGGDPKKDFSIQLIPSNHLRYFSEIHSNKKLAENYGLAFASISRAISEILKEQGGEINKIPIGTYGKCKHEDEHIHIKIFPYRGNIGQPFTVDSSFGKKEINLDKDTGEEFIKLKPVRKTNIPNENLEYLSQRLIKLLNN